MENGKKIDISHYTVPAQKTMSETLQNNKGKLGFGGILALIAIGLILWAIFHPKSE